MPVLRNTKHEAYAQAMASGKSATEAMKEAGLKDARNSSRLTKNDEIARRIEEIKVRVSEKAEWSSAARLKMLGVIARSNIRRDPRASISAIAEANKMQGSHAAVRHQIGGVKDEPIEFVHKIERAVVRPPERET